MTVAQEHYLVGAATRSIDPKAPPYSLSLSGFAAPKEGRFSLTWEAVHAPEKTVVAALATKKTGPHALPVHPYKGYNYYTDADGNLFKRNTRVAAAAPIKIATEQKGKLVSITADAENLYALNSNDSIWRFNPAITNNPWQLIGRNNNATYNMHLEAIACHNNQLFGVTGAGIVYKAIHATDHTLSVTAMAIGFEKKKILLIGTDLTGFALSYINTVKNIISAKYKIPAAAILVNASHTHFAPVTRGWSTWEPFYQYPDSSYLNTTLKNALLNCVAAAMDSMQPATLKFGVGTTAIGFNRRNTKEIIRPYDNTVDLLETQSIRTKEKNILFLTGCHAVFTGTEPSIYILSANYPGVTRELLIKSGYKNALFIQGCGGDINPVDLDFKKAGTDLATDIQKTLAKGLGNVAPGALSYYLDAVNVHTTPWSRDSIQKFKTDNTVQDTSIVEDRNIRWADLMLQSKSPLSDNMKIYVQTINIGDLKIVGLSREVVNEYGTAIRQLWPQKKVMVAGYCNDVPSYLPNDWHIEKKFYEGYDSFFWYGQPALPPTSIMSTVVNKVRENNR
ncbi:hypothetical protein NIASO_03420 [Niabella soli DSM 19437]|uniref:Neutral/alkaline non-lysosomal ceramidase N-terminal domain-containing protein n=2 Tax=Niabella TaxID=379899 RepID=W0F772_9BACT|nr:hypothetical protein NIASO_03420 [Niabella soli DSM 19437]